MIQPFILAIGLIPLLFRLGPMVLPETWLEPYGYWSSKDLNLLEGQDIPTTFWRNQGYWRVSRYLEFTHTALVSFEMVWVVLIAGYHRLPRGCRGVSCKITGIRRCQTGRLNPWYVIRHLDLTARLMVLLDMAHGSGESLCESSRSLGVV
jgi:hypothetical protein